MGSIALNIGKDISDNNYGEISTMDKNSEKWYSLCLKKIWPLGLFLSKNNLSFQLMPELNPLYSLLNPLDSSF